MLQRQVYRSGPTPVMTAGSGAAVDAELRMDRLEAQMRELTGRIEDAVNGVEQLRRRLEQINSDIDVRFSQGQGQPRNPGSRLTCRRHHTDSAPRDDGNAWPWTEYDSCTGRYSCRRTAGQRCRRAPWCLPTGSPDRIRHLTPPPQAARTRRYRDCSGFRPRLVPGCRPALLRAI
jgi:hypothetical protein